MDHINLSIPILEHDCAYGNTCHEGYLKKARTHYGRDDIMPAHQNLLWICFKCLKQLHFCIGILHRLKGKHQCQVKNLSYLKQEYLYILLSILTILLAFVVLPSLNFCAQSSVSWDQSLLSIVVLGLLRYYVTLQFLAMCGLFEENLGMQNTDSNDEKKTRKYFSEKCQAVELITKDEDYVEMHMPCKVGSVSVPNCPVKTWLHTPWRKRNMMLPVIQQWKSSSLLTSKFWFIAILLIGTLLQTSSCEEMRNQSVEPILGSYFLNSLKQESECSRGKLFCDHFSLDSLLDNEELQQCTGENRTITDHCCDPILHVMKRDKAGKNYMDLFSLTLGKYATVTTYSLQWSVQRCKVAYKNWICSMQHRYFSDCPSGTRSHIPPCHSLCTYVERSCPFFRVHNFTKLYGGQSTFLCNGGDESQASSNATCYNLDDMTRPNYPTRQVSDTSERISCESRDQTVRLERKSVKTLVAQVNKVEDKRGRNESELTQPVSNSAVSIFNFYLIASVLNLCFMTIQNSDILLNESRAVL